MINNVFQTMTDAESLIESDPLDIEPCLFSIREKSEKEGFYKITDSHGYTWLQKKTSDGSVLSVIQTAHGLKYMASAPGEPVYIGQEGDRYVRRGHNEQLSYWTPFTK